MGPIKLEKGSTYSLALEGGFVGYSIWIDFNKDGDFGEIGERVFKHNAYLGVITGSLTIPCNAP